VVLKDSKIDFEIESNPEKPGKAPKSEDEAEPALAE
jgi:ATP-dependent Clp protease ATP-binding subunit ClpA